MINLKEQEELYSLLKDSADEKRKSKIEKKQKQFLLKNIEEVCKSFDGEMRVDMSSFNTHIKANRWFLKQDGNLANRDYDEYNKIYDTKTFDAVIGVEILPIALHMTLCFIMKGVHQQGGYQDLVGKEIGIYVNAINKNTDDNIHFFFILDGDAINNFDFHQQVGLNDKYTLTSTYDFDIDFRKFINNKIYEYNGKR